MPIVRQWDLNVDGPIPGVVFRAKNFNPTHSVRITDERGDWYGLTDGKRTFKVLLLTPPLEKATTTD